MRSIGMAHEESPLVGSRRDRDVEKSHHHFVFSLIAPAHSHVWIRIVWVFPRVVVDRDGLQFRSGLQRQRRSEPVAQLPVKIPMHTQQRMSRAVAVKNVVFKFLTAEMHVRKKTE